MNLAANASKYTTILFNYSAQSLYSALHEGINMTWPMDLSTIKTPRDIDKTCLVQGFNMHGPQRSPRIKSRVGLESQSYPECRYPHLVRGVGIGFRGNLSITCGEIILSYSYPQREAYPTFCRIYIQ